MLLILYGLFKYLNPSFYVLQLMNLGLDLT